MKIDKFGWLGLGLAVGVVAFSGYRETTIAPPMEERGTLDMPIEY